MDILIIGGTGNISWRLTHAALMAGWRVTVLNRGGVDRVRRAAPPGCTVLNGDIRAPVAVEALLGADIYDVVVDFLCYNAPQARQATDYFTRRARHYVFISTTALYEREAARLPFTESFPAIERGWDYAVGKAEAEKVFTDARMRQGFPVTILRPAHTYDTIIPEAVGNGDWTNPWRLLNGKPVVVHGDGTTLWTVTHSRDLADGIVAFLKSGHAPGETFHITADETYTWREITAALCHELGVASPAICYRTTEEVDKISPRLGNGIKGHKMWCDVYDNRKFKAACPDWRAKVALADGIRETVGYYRGNRQLMVPNEQLNSILDALCALR